MEDAHLAAVLGMAKTYSSITRALDAELGSHHGIGLAELRLLAILAARPLARLRPTDLAGELGITASGVTRALLPLVKRGILKREPVPGDARSTRVALTAAGRTLTADAQRTAAEGASRLLRRLSVGQTRQLERLLGEIA